MGRLLRSILVLLCGLSCQPWLLRALPLCTDSTAPVPLNGTLGFCPYSGTSCCDAAADAALRKQVQAMNVSDAACAAVLKSVLCAVRTAFIYIFLLPPISGPKKSRPCYYYFQHACSLGGWTLHVRPSS
jgi:hypothetical protein